MLNGNGENEIDDKTMYFRMSVYDRKHQFNDIFDLVDSTDEFKGINFHVTTLLMILNDYLRCRGGEI